MKQNFVLVVERQQKAFHAVAVALKILRAAPTRAATIEPLREIGTLVSNELRRLDQKQADEFLTALQRTTGIRVAELELAALVSRTLPPRAPKAFPHAFLKPSLN